MISYAIEDRLAAAPEACAPSWSPPFAPLLAPIARDDEVSLADSASQLLGSVSVDVLTNDEDPDGDIQDDTLSARIRASAPSGGLLIPLSPKPQTVIYTVTDHDGLSASAIVPRCPEPRSPGQRWTPAPCRSRSRPASLRKSRSTTTF